ncbi:hypothetical protein PG997_004161 [Apiospora hydei]|uniref:Uncharacterized protein n=1 Tax=Apiospora hydei TaxID=1337664 RepID=A0ABR1X1F3_9PEZI
MSSDEDSDYDGFGGNSAHPFTWVMVPIVVLAIAAVLMTCMRYRRRNKMLRAFGTNPPDRDLESMGSSRYRRPAGASRWQWAGAGDAPRGVGRRRFGLGVASREEGLNELGEAPPAYSKSLQQGDHIEMGAPTASVAPSATGAQAAPEPRGPGDARTSSPPAYDGSSSNNSTIPSAPPPAILPSR